MWRGENVIKFNTKNADVAKFYKAPNKIVLPGEVDIISYCVLGSARCQPVRGVGVLD